MGMLLYSGMVPSFPNGLTYKLGNKVTLPEISEMSGIV